MQKVSHIAKGPEFVWFCNKTNNIRADLEKWYIYIISQYILKWNYNDDKLNIF